MESGAARLGRWISVPGALPVHMPRSGAQQKSAAPPSIETIEQDIERIAKASRPVRFESFEG
jgi:hypothetical protein